MAYNAGTERNTMGDDENTVFTWRRDDDYDYTAVRGDAAEETRMR